MTFGRIVPEGVRKVCGSYEVIVWVQDRHNFFLYTLYDAMVLHNAP